ncbi:hypothetical protein GMDG_05846 [Pseudogymnoascus destructans 20631-21]|uniref:Phospholipase/carboxylesterase/thioesterase domain-containing protein n=1 Tax=Pseudogymnoascus destructans (strain ATCC MYA-4855 / 20631-21) TaxID=658429 RepID=L8FTE6_PSED2|nr:hypothetical protein GMDG_05846 [Pseudogymnoascus destructans 20631-21]
MPTLPTPSHFASHPSLASSLLITPPPEPTPTPTPPRSVLILLHGLGDTNAPFHNLASQLSLPHAACISLRAPSPIPALMTGTDQTGFHWGDDLSLDSRTGALDFDAGFSTAARPLGDLLGVLLGECGFVARDVHFLGYGQGGMAALAVVEAWPGVEFGGVIAIGTGIAGSKSAMGEVRGYVSSLTIGEGKARTPVLVCGGSSGTVVTAGVLREVKERFGAVEYVMWERGGDGMPRSRGEMMVLMRFWGGRIRGPVPEGMEEVGGAA